MKTVLTSALTSLAILLAICSCATAPKGPLNPGEMRLLSLDLPDNGNLKTNVTHQVSIRFKADGRPEIRRACFTWSGDGPYCLRVKDVTYDSGASLEVSLYPLLGQYRLECYVEYVREGKVVRTNTVTSYVTGFM